MRRRPYEEETMHLREEALEASLPGSEARAKTSIAQHWQLILLLAVVVVLFYQVIIGMVGQWYSDSDYSHGFVVPIFSGYLIWQRRSALALLKAQPSWWGMAVIVFSLSSLFLGSLGAEFFLTRVALVGVIIGLIVLFRGFPTLKALAFPLAFLFLMIPLPVIVYNEIVFPLQLLASRFAGACLQQSHVFPVLREGNLLVLPNYTLEVVEACSGIRSLMTLVTLALAYGYLVERSYIMRALLVAIVVPIAVVANGVRVMIAAILTYYLGPERGEGALHSVAGIIIFLIATLLLIGVHVLLNYLRRLFPSSRAHEETA